MSDLNNIYPELTELGKIEAQLIMDSFKPKINAMIEDMLSEMYTNVAEYVESDSWTNYRNTIINGIAGYRKNKLHESYYKEIRRAIYEGNKEEIVKDLNQDIIEENEKLKKEIRDIYNQNIRSY